MADELPDITQISQAALELPQAIANIETTHLSEKMGVLNAEIQKLGSTVPMGLPALPGVEKLALPMLPGIQAGAGAPDETPPTKPVGERKVRSYMEV